MAYDPLSPQLSGFVSGFSLKHHLPSSISPLTPNQACLPLWAPVLFHWPLRCGLKLLMGTWPGRLKTEVQAGAGGMGHPDSEP